MVKERTSRLGPKTQWIEILTAQEELNVRKDDEFLKARPLGVENLEARIVGMVKSQRYGASWHKKNSYENESSALIKWGTRRTKFRKILTLEAIKVRCIVN